MSDPIITPLICQKCERPIADHISATGGEIMCPRVEPSGATIIPIWRKDEHA